MITFHYDAELGLVTDEDLDRMLQEEAGKFYAKYSHWTMAPSVVVKERKEMFHRHMRILSDMEQVPSMAFQLMLKRDAQWLDIPQSQLPLFLQ